MSNYDDPAIYPDHLSEDQLQEIADAYQPNVTTQQVADQFDLTRDQFMAVRARYDLRKNEPTIIKNMSEEASVDHLAYVSKKQHRA